MAEPEVTICAWGKCVQPAAPSHDPCCSSKCSGHGRPHCCEHYRYTHFVEVRPCCGVDARLLETEAAS